MTRKELNAVKANSWLELMDKNDTWKSSIEKSIMKTFVRKEKLVSKDEIAYMSSKAGNHNLSNVELTNENTYDAICRLYDIAKPIGVLNFASYFNPGGGFIRGAGTQEESLCHVSGLYPILRAQKIYSTRRLNKDTPSAYGNEVIYSRNVPFTFAEGHLGDPCLIDVISVAAPNCNRVPITAMDSYEEALRKRIEAIVILPYLNGCDTLILGAWGCGVFKNDPKTVATIFKETLIKYGAAYSNIVFPLPNDNVRKVFEEVFNLEDFV